MVRTVTGRATARSIFCQAQSRPGHTEEIRGLGALISATANEPFENRLCPSGRGQQQR